MKCKILIPLLCVLPLAVCNAGSVRLWSGDTLKGKISWDPKTGLTITPDPATPGTPVTSTKIDLTKVRDTIFTDPVAPAAPAVPPVPVPPPSQPVGVFLTNGDFIAGVTRDIESPVVKVEAQPVPATSIAWIIFNPIPLDKFPKVAPGHTGAILPGGDFFEGTFAGIQEYRIGINSPLLGPQRFPMDQIAAVVMHDRQPSQALYMVTANNGSSFQTDDLKFDKQGVDFQDPILGPIKLKFWDIKEIAAGSGRFQIITDSDPVATATLGSAAKTPDDFQVQPGADPAAPATLLTRVNIPITYAVPVGLTVFSATIAVPKDSPAGTHFTFAVYGDGRFLIQRSLPIGVGDPPQLFRMELSNVHTISLRVEPSFAGGPDKIYGQWIGPMLFRP